jgi:regulator of ribonuclease activity A
VNFTTADLCDSYPDLVHVAEPVLHNYGGVIRFGGEMETLQVFEDNALVREVLETAGRGRVLVVDGRGSLRTALVGGQLAALAQANRWSGVVVNGCIRDSAEIAELAVGIRALATAPVRSSKTGAGTRGTPITFAGLTFTPGEYLYADEDGVLVANRSLTD